MATRSRTSSQSPRQRVKRTTSKRTTNPARENAAKALFGVEIGGTKIQVVAGSLEAKILARHRFAVDARRGAAGILTQIKSAFDDLLQKFRPLSAAIAFGGPVDWRTGVTCRSHQVEGWTDFALGNWAAKILRAPVSVDNDANIAA